MEADWEFEIAADAPVIDAAWAGFVDLRKRPEQVAAISEVGRLPELGPVLQRLNAAGSAVFTAKCDVWKPDWNAGEVDADELDASRESAQCALACYIDLLPGGDRVWATPEAAAAWARNFCSALKGAPLRQCRIDFVIRRAFFTPAETGIGITCYVTGCGATEAEAAEMLARALRAFSESAKGIATADSPA